MERLTSELDASSEQFRDNARHMEELVERFRDERTRVLEGGSGAARQAALGKLPVRERLERLLDPGTPFLEIGGLAAHDMYDGKAPGAGLVTGVGMIEGVECVVVANDPSVKGGTYFPITVKKHLRAQEVALANHLPCVYLVDSGGAFLPLQSEVFPDREHFGRIFFNQANLSALRIP
ncbi:MAG: carboxyl transferase domain-containing protein, partial [Myxococcota bacterium]|nr:carboxyl transferase domain-containing protein [Myxococcota bacterium]